MRILAVGDIVGKPGRRALKEILPSLRNELGLDLVVVNGENAAGGKGLTPDTAQEIFQAGADIITSGNHIWDQREIVPLLEGEAPILRPANYPAGLPGRGHLMKKGVLVVNLTGRTFMGPYDSPFAAVDNLLEKYRDRAKVTFLDFHAEATSEKIAMGWYVDGRMTAVVGTHIHVPTADPRLLPKGTAFVTDIGMVGPRDSVIGDDPKEVLERFLTLTPSRLNVAECPVVQFNSVLIEVDETSGKAKSIRRIDREVIIQS